MAGGRAGSNVDAPKTVATKTDRSWMKVRANMVAVFETKLRLYERKTLNKRVT